jgi:ribonuclease D
MIEESVTPLLKPRRPAVFIDTETKLAEACAQLQHESGAFAIDAERASGFKYGQRAYLIQVARATGSIYLIDPATISPSFDPADFNDLARVLASDIWLLHAATQDLPCLAELGLVPSKIFDTELGSRIVGLPRVGLGAVVEHYLGVALAKEHSAVDWSKRPLDASWLQYAALDVDVLHELAAQLEDDLKKNDKLDWALEEFEHLLGFKPKPENPERWRTITGLHEVKAQQGLAVARAIWRARESLAMKLDVAPGRLIPDSSISHVSKTMHKTRPELASDKAFAGRASRSYLDTWWSALEEGRAERDLPPLKLANSGIPNHRSWPARWPQANQRLICARHNLSNLAKELSVPLENLISPESIRQICWIERQNASEDQIREELKGLKARSWQIELITQVICESIQQSPNFKVPSVEPEANTED